MEVMQGYKQTEAGLIHWDERTFGSLYLEPSRNGIYKTADFQGRGTRIVNMGEMFGYEFLSEQHTTLLPANSIVVVTRSGILRKYLPVAMNMIPMAINQDIKALIPNDEVLPTYVLHVLIANGGRILARCLKSGTTVESIELRWLKAFTIPLPPIPEQTAIATVLSEMDAEIAALEAKLAKYRQLKQGMMHNLLTGRIRLI